MNTSCLARKDVVRLEKLFDQQMWAFGRDVQSPSGNLLIHYGMSKSTATQEGRSSLYRKDPVSLDSTGAQLGAVRLERGPLKNSGSTTELQQLLRWLLTYERWVRVTAPEWRSIALNARRRPVPFSASAMLEVYEQLIAALHRSDTPDQSTEAWVAPFTPSTSVDSEGNFEGRVSSAQINEDISAVESFY
jgi:hypothetical protein